MRKNYLFFAMKRAGQHGIINWFCHQFNGDVVHLNNCVKGWKSGHALPMKKNMYILYDNKNRTVTDFFLRPLPEFRHTDFSGVPTWVFNIEDMDLSHFTSFGMDSFPEFKDDTDIILILRDPFNFVASCLKRRDTAKNKGALDVYKNIDQRMHLWIQHAKQATGEKCIINDRPIQIISFNQWFASQDYRRQLSTKFGVQFSDNGLQDVVWLGDGSSFDYRKYNNRAQKMKVMERWQEFRNDPKFLSLMTDEVKRLSRELFDFCPI